MAATVRVPPEPSLLQNAAPVLSNRQELRVEGCHFAPTYDARWKHPSAALHVAGPGWLYVDVRACVFEGRAAAMIHARTCTLSVTNCQFGNAPLPVKPGMEASAGPRRPQGGVDIFLDRFGEDSPATLYAQDCRTTSPQFLSTCEGLSRGAEVPPGVDVTAGSACDSTIVALHHAHDVRDQGADARPAAVDWRIPATHGARLTLIGCRFDWRDLSEAPAVHGSLDAALTDIGSFSGLGVGSPLRLVQVDGAVEGDPRHAIVPRLSDPP